MTESKSYPRWLFWVAAFSFLWAFLIFPLAAKRLGGSGWMATFGYSIICVVAGIYTIRKNWSTGLMFALANFLCATGWVVFVVWASRAFARSFWR